MKHNPLIVALDTPSSLAAMNLVHKLKVTGVAFKIGFEMFVSLGPKFVSKVVNQDVRVFLDLKFHDIPNTVAKTVGEAARLGVWMVNVHASGGAEMLKAARESVDKAADLEGIEAPQLVAVTVLTSLLRIQVEESQATAEASHQVRYLAKLSKAQGLDGVVASGQEAPLIRETCGKNFLIVTPGIRFSTAKSDDQTRVMTPRDAMRSGSTHLVVGRPITQAKSPLKAVDEILSSLN